METVLALFFMIFGLGFFMYVMKEQHADRREAWERRIMEAREFGFGGKNQHTAKTLQKD